MREPAILSSGERGYPDKLAADGDAGDDAAREEQDEALAPADPTGHRIDPLLRTAEDARTAADAEVAALLPIDAPEDRRATEGEADATTDFELLGDSVAQSSEANRGEKPVAETKPLATDPARPPSAQPLPPQAAPGAPGTEPRDQGYAAPLPAGHAAPGDAKATSAPSVVAAGPLSSGARQAAGGPVEPGTAAAEDAVGDAALPAVANHARPSDALGPRQEQAVATDRGRADRPGALLQRPAVSAAVEAEGEGQPRERPSSDAPIEPQARPAEPSAKQPPTPDLQPSRLVQASGMPGSVAAAPDAAGGMGGEVVHLTGRGPDGAVSVDAAQRSAVQQVALQITKAVDQGRTEIRIRLDPPELGEVDIQLEFRELRVTASLSAERAETLDLLQRDSRALTRALREAGLELADADVSFTSHGRDERPGSGGHAQGTINLPRPSPSVPDWRLLAPLLPGPQGFVSLSDGRMDLRV